MAKNDTAVGTMREALANLVSAGRSWLAALNMRRTHHDLKGDLQIQERNAAQDVEDALHVVIAHEEQQHLDDIAVDGTAEAMKQRLTEKRAEGRGGWHDPEESTVEYIAALLVGAVLKGKPVDVANFAMMLHQRGAARHVLTNALINHCALASPRNLEDLAAELLAPRDIVRDQDGHLQHPAMPITGEDVHLDEFLGAFGLETSFIDMESDDAAAFERYIDSESTDCRSWTPSRPKGDDWQLIEIYESEDGPCAMYARRAPEAARAPRGAHTLPLTARITRVKTAQGEITLQLGHQVPRYTTAGLRIICWTAGADDSAEGFTAVGGTDA